MRFQRLQAYVMRPVYLIRERLKGDISGQNHSRRYGSGFKGLSRHWRYRLFPGLLTMVLVIGLSLEWPLSGLQAATTIAPPLSTQGANIVDSRGHTVLLRGVNWFGLETESQAPHGLWQRDYKDMLEQIKRLGYNSVRLPYSVQGLRATTFSGVDFSIGSNQDLEGKTPLEVMDLVIQEAERQGLMIILDSHRLNNQRIPELWYGDGYSEDDWIQTWVMLATRYRNQRNVIGADLKNEPHGQASWGTGDRATDWRLAAERAGNAILAVNPDWLIIVEGVEKNVPDQQLEGHWMGGNLEGVRNYPVRLSRPGKLVYSPHEYGPGVYNQPWFSDPSFPDNMPERWEIGFHYIATEEIAPVWIGEFGGRQVDRRSPEGVWQRLLVNYIEDNELSFAYWSWNPNSADTGGILLDDWQTVDSSKQQLLNQLLPAPRVATNSPPIPASPVTVPSPARPSPTPTSRISPSISPSSQPSPTSSSSPAPTSGLRAESTIQSDWQTGFCASFRITNSSNTSVENWRLIFDMSHAEINQSWNGTFTRQGSRYTVTPPSWAQTLQPNQTMDMGFCANKQGSNHYPRNVSPTLL